MTKGFEGPVHPGGAAHVQGIRTATVDNDVIIVGDPKTPDQFFEFGDRGHLARGIVDLGSPTRR